MNPEVLALHGKGGGRGNDASLLAVSIPAVPSDLKQNVRIRPWCGPKNKKYYIRSGNVYENKQNSDSMPDEMTDICAGSSRILQKIGGSEGHFGMKNTLATCFLPNAGAVNAPRQSRQRPCAMAIPLKGNGTSPGHARTEAGVAVKKQTISRQGAKAQRLAKSKRKVLFASSATLRLGVKCFCPSRNYFTASL